MPTERTDTFIFDSIEGNVDAGGWTASGAFVNDQAAADYCRRGDIWMMPEGAGIWDPSFSLAIRGSLLPKDIMFDRRQSRTSVVLSTSHTFLQNAGLQGIYFAKVAVPTHPHQATSWTLGKIVAHLVEQHTNISSTAFIQNADGSYSANPVGGWVDTTGIDETDSTSVDVYTVKASNSLWSTIKMIGWNEFYVPYFKRDDRLIYAVHPMFASTLPTPVFEIDNTYIIGQPQVRYRDEVTPDQVQLYALTDDGDILQSFYPENVGTEGRRHKETHLRCNSQARLNELAQRLWLYLQRNYVVDLTLAGPWGLRMELYDRVELTWIGTYNGMNFVWNQKKFWINRISVRRMHTFGAITELVLEEEDYGEGYFYA